ncbi:MAG: HD domain-containing phosphohydrolase [Gemmatimonadota bacterium]
MSAIDNFEAAAAGAAAIGDLALLVDSLRRLAIVHHRRQNEREADAAGRRAFRIATKLGDDHRIAEVLNTLGGFALARGQLDVAGKRYRRGLALVAQNPGLRARIRQNLGIVANIRGDLATALDHYTESLKAYQAAGDKSGCAIAYHNLGMIQVDRGLIDAADDHFRYALELTTEDHDQYQRAVCLINHCEVHLARRDFPKAKRQTEKALAILDAIGERRPKADAYKVLGIVYRETRRPVMAESRLRDSIQVARESGSVLVEAEATRELAILARQAGRNQEALQALNEARRLFARLQAHVDIVDVAAREKDLEQVYLDVVREWGASIESADAYTHGHSSRVAEYAVAIACSLGLDDLMLTTIRVGAFLHDLGKVRVPHEILNKAGRLTESEFAVMQQHPVFGVELLSRVEFPWNIIPIVRWHHERFDGRGYPDGLSGDEIPIEAQIVCIADVYDALTSTRSYRSAMSIDDAHGIIRESAHFWRPEVMEAFFDAGPSPVRDVPTEL